MRNERSSLAMFRSLKKSAANFHQGDDVMRANSNFRKPLAAVILTALLLPTTVLAASWSRIAAEWGSFTLSGVQTVRYGSGSTWITRTMSGSGQCTNAFFGGDPLVGVVKQCEVAVPSVASFTCSLLTA